MANLSFHEFIKKKIEGEKVCVEETRIDESIPQSATIPLIEESIDSELAIAKRYIQELEKDKTQSKIHESNSKENSNFYKLYRDKAENFVCEIDAEGDAKLENTKARLIIEGEDWNLLFDGTIDKASGKCVIPLKKMKILEEGEKGKIRLEVIAGDTMFIPWEEEFIAISSKKISVKFEDKEQTKEPSIKVTKIR